MNIYRSSIFVTAMLVFISIDAKADCPGSLLCASYDYNLPVNIVSPTGPAFTVMGGNVGIGTTTPSQPLSVAGVIESTSGGVKFPDGTVQTTASTGGSSQWTTSGTNISYSSGNVGIGTASPAQKLSVNGIVESTTGGFKFPDGSIQATAATSGGSGSYANQTLSNLTSPTAVNVDVLPSTDNAVKLGEAGLAFKEVNSVSVNASAGVGTPTVSSPTGDVTLNLTDSIKEFFLTVADGVHLNFSQTSSPTAVAQPAAGTGATCTLTGNDTAGKFTITAGSGSFGTGAICVITFAKSWGGSNPPTCIYSPANGAGAAWVGNRQTYITTTSTTMSFNGTTSASTAGQAYSFSYHCFGAE